MQALHWLWRRQVCLHLRRLGFKDAAACGDNLVAALRRKGPTAAVAIDHACLCESMDVVGRFGFGFDCRAVRCNLSQPLHHAARLTPNTTMRSSATSQRCRLRARGYNRLRARGYNIRARCNAGCNDDLLYMLSC